MLGDWTLGVRGEVVRVERENIDKSGRNPRYMLSFVVRPQQVEAPAGATLPAEIAARIAEHELPRLGPEPRVGEKIIITARASGPRPATFYLQTLARP